MSLQEDSHIRDPLPWATHGRPLMRPGMEGSLLAAPELGSGPGCL